jgi:hypothetical protein
VANKNGSEDKTEQSRRITTRDLESIAKGAAEAAADAVRDEREAEDVPTLQGTEEAPAKPETVIRVEIPVPSKDEVKEAGGAVGLLSKMMGSGKGQLGILSLVGTVFFGGNQAITWSWAQNAAQNDERAVVVAKEQATVAVKETAKEEVDKATSEAVLQVHARIDRVHAEYTRRFEKQYEVIEGQRAEIRVLSDRLIFLAGKLSVVMPATTTSTTNPLRPHPP